MKKSEIFSIRIIILPVFIFIITAVAAAGQNVSAGSAALPENINKIVSFSCMPCHSSTGGTLSKGKLNFNEWTAYTADKQKKKAEEMYKELKKNAMPPKSARENNPDIIPTTDQIEIIKAWADSLQAESK
jgi:hypothetical protein